MKVTKSKRTNVESVEEETEEEVVREYTEKAPPVTTEEGDGSAGPSQVRTPMAISQKQ